MEPNSDNIGTSERRRHGLLTHALLIMMMFASVLFVAPPAASAGPVLDGNLTGRIFHNGSGYKTRYLEQRPVVRADIHTGRLIAFTGHGGGALFENAEGFAEFSEPFTVDRPTDTLAFDVRWKGALSASLSLDASAEVNIRIRIMRTDGDTDTEIWSETLFEKATRGQLLELVTYEGGGPRLVGAEQGLPLLQPETNYRMELRVTCNSQVGVAVAGTACDFHWAAHTRGDLHPAIDKGFGVWLRSWSFPLEEQEPCERFNDVPAGAFFEVPVDWAACRGITTGTTPTTFSPSATLSRGQMATLLWRDSGKPAAGSHPFADVPAGAYYSQPVGWMANEGITTGTTATTFSPSGVVTRGQLATFLWRHAGKPIGKRPLFSPVNYYEHSFTDVPAGAYYDDAVAWMSEEGITTGTSATTFSPNRPVTRAEAVTFLYRYREFTPSIIFHVFAD